MYRHTKLCQFSLAITRITFKKSLYYFIFIMNDTNNQFIDDDGLSKFTSLTHLLNDDNSTDTGDYRIDKTLTILFGN